jgi:cysteine desulfurase
MMNQFREYIGKVCGFSSCCAEDRDDKVPASSRSNPNKYKVIFTSGASEANAMVITSVISSYSLARKITPHIVVSSIEHKSIIEAVKSYESRGLVTATFVKPTASGHIQPADIESAILPNTCLVCVMHANNETGAINNIKEIGLRAHKVNVPFHCDTVQSFGKSPIQPLKDNVDSFSVSFHKLGGPPGVGALIIKQQFLNGYKLQPIIFGSQNEGLRGGTENLPGIGASFTALKYNMESRTEKNNRITSIKKYIMDEISQRIPTSYFTQYGSGPKHAVEIVFLSSLDGYLCNTLLISIVKRTKPKICNVKIKQALESKGIVVGIGSACNTASSKASHVLYEMNADELVRAGVLRISLGDENTKEQATVFIKELLLAIKKQI